MQSQPRVNFAGMPVGKTDMASVAGDFSYHNRNGAAGSIGSYAAGS